MTVAAVIFASYFDKKIAVFTKESNQIEGRLFSALTDYLGNIRTIITLRLGLQAEKDIDSRAIEIIPVLHKRIKWRQWRGLGVDFFVDTVLIACVVYMVLTFQKKPDNFKIGNLVMVITYLRQMNSSIYQASRFLARFRKTSPTMKVCRL
ncbi:MAG: transporter [Alphaproteobacteria bacterium]|nr:transporter [Alphaproteobacteria bacterium]